MITIAGLYEFTTRCASIGIEVPAAIQRGLRLIEVAQEHAQLPAAPNLLQLSDSEIRERVEAIAIRFHTTQAGTAPGLQIGLDQITNELLEAIGREVRPDLDRIIEELQPQFEELAAPLLTASRDYGFTYATTSDDVIEMADEGASAAWRATPRAWSAIAPIVNLRIAMSNTFDVSPTMDDTRAHAFPRSPGTTTTNYSVCFAADDNWSLDAGYYIEGKTAGHLDWLALARGGLRLNTPTEVAEKIAARRAHPFR